MTLIPTHFIFIALDIILEYYSIVCSTILNYSTLHCIILYYTILIYIYVYYTIILHDFDIVSMHNMYKRWIKDAEFDKTISERFGAVHTAAASSELDYWRTTARGRLAEIIVLDQFSRNMFRDKSTAFATDPLALALAQTAVAVGADAELLANEKQFLYMPYMHSESKVVHEKAVSLFGGLGEYLLGFEMKHKNIIDRFGRFPHRNAVLGRQSTTEEIEFLSGPDSSF